MQWNSHGPNMLTPGSEDTHINCRCYLQPAGEEQAPKFAGVGE
jgi:hypothetical protein